MPLTLLVFCQRFRRAAGLHLMAVPTNGLRFWFASAVLCLQDEVHRLCSAAASDEVVSGYCPRESKVNVYNEVYNGKGFSPINSDKSRS